MVRRTGPITISDKMRRWLDSKVLRPRSGRSQSISDEETPVMNMIAPTTPLAEILDRLATVAEKWLASQVSNEETEKPSGGPEYLTPEEAAPILRVSVYTVQKLCREGKITAPKIGSNKVSGKGGKYLIPREAVDAYLRKQTLIHGEKRRAAK
jgi:excisionase family DNA binding protein